MDVERAMLKKRRLNRPPRILGGIFYRKVASEAICLYGDTNKLKDT